MRKKVGKEIYKLKHKDIDLINKTREVKEELERKLADGSMNLNDDEVLDLSQKLDEIIVIYLHKMM